MIETFLFVGVALALLLILLWLAGRPVAPPFTRATEAKLEIEDLFPLHYRHFPQVRQALSSGDLAYLRERASPQIVRQVRAERREVVRQFLVGLKEDFLRLDRLARTVAALSPEISRAQEAGRFWLGVRFRILHGLVQLKLATGWISLPQLGRLTELIGSLAVHMETAMTALEQTSIERLRSNLSA